MLIISTLLGNFPLIVEAWRRCIIASSLQGMEVDIGMVRVVDRMRRVKASRGALLTILASISFSDGVS